MRLVPSYQEGTRNTEGYCVEIQKRDWSEVSPLLSRGDAKYRGVLYGDKLLFVYNGGFRPLFSKGGRKVLGGIDLSL